MLVGGAGADALIGGAGIDRAQYADATQGVTADLAIPSHNTGIAAGDSYSSVEDLFGSSYDDNLYGDNGANRIWGSAGTDVLFGRNGNDTLDGGDGDDVLVGGAGADALIGGAGVDRVQYNDATSGVTADLTDPTNNTGIAAGDTYSSIENLYGSSFDDRLYGDSGANELFGTDGNDVLYGRDGNDVLRGGTGTNTLVGGAGDDTYYVDSDLIYNYVATDRIIENAGEGFDRIITSVSIDLRFNNLGQEIEVLETDDINRKTSLVLEGNEFTHTIIGNAGDNLLQGWTGDDTLFGGDGDDRLTGLGGNDTLHGGAGNDILVGGLVSDDLVDSYVFDTPLNDTGWSSGYPSSSLSNVDRIENFKFGRDRIVLDHNIFTALTPGALPDSAFSLSFFAADADDRIMQSGGAFLYDPDGTGSAPGVLFAVLSPPSSNVPSLSASSFIVI